MALAINQSDIGKSMILSITKENETNHYLAKLTLIYKKDGVDVGCFSTPPSGNFFLENGDPDCSYTVIDNGGGPSPTPTGSTLADYGITDAYTKTEVDDKLNKVCRYMGSVATTVDLPTTNQVGDIYHINSTNAECIWTGSAWEDIGTGIIVDTEMSDTSENAVQNKVIKAYVDNSVADELTLANNQAVDGKSSSSTISQKDAAYKNTSIRFNRTIADDPKAIVSISWGLDSANTDTMKLMPYESVVTRLSTKQDVLTAGEGITIDSNTDTISADVGKTMSDEDWEALWQ